MDKFENPKAISRQEAEVMFASNDVKKITHALVSIALFEKEYRWAEDKCLKYLSSPDDSISGLAASCLGHIARVHGILNKEEVLKALRDKLSNNGIKGRVEDAINDIEMFVKQ